MKKKFSIYIAILAYAFIGCSSPREKAQEQIKTLSVQLDSVDGVFQNTDWDFWNKISHSMNVNISIIGQYSDLALKTDPSFRSYYGPYSTAGKVLSRVLRKSKSEIQDELLLAKKQIESIKNISHDSDSLSIYIEQEHHAIEELIFKVTTLENTLTHQLEAYKATYNQADELVAKLKSINPAIGSNSNEILYEED